MCSSLTEGEGCLAGAKRFDVIGRSTLSLAAPADSSGTSWSWPVARLSAGAGRAGGGRLNGCCLPRRIENGPCLHAAHELYVEVGTPRLPCSGSLAAAGRPNEQRPNETGGKAHPPKTKDPSSDSVRSQAQRPKTPGS